MTQAAERAEEFVELAERGWRWVLDQVRWDDAGPWIPEHVASDEDAGVGMYAGIGGLAHTLAELRLLRAWTDEEQRLADGIADRIRAVLSTREDSSWSNGLASDIGALEALDEPGSEAALQRLLDLAVPHGWIQHWWDELGADKVVTDIIGGTTGVLLASLWSSGEESRAVAEHAVTALLACTEETATGPTWPIIPTAQRPEDLRELPNFSHGTAGAAAALALTGRMLGRPDLVETAVRGAEHLVALANTEHHGFELRNAFPPRDTDEFPVSYGWCHGPTGTSYLFAALELAGVDSVAGESPASWHRRCLTSVVNSGLPMRISPGFWDNDGRCCGTAGVGDAFLDSYQRLGDSYDLAFAETLGLALEERAFTDGDRAWWRFVEHRNPEPLLPPGIGWMQGAAGIAAYLLRLGRVLADGRDAPAIERMENWWAIGR